MPKLKGEPQTRKRVRYMMMGNALLAGEHAPVYVHPKQRLKDPPKGGSAVANMGSLFDIGVGAGELGVNLLFRPTRTYDKVKRNFNKRVDSAVHDYKYENHITSPIYQGITEDEILERHKRERDIRKGSVDEDRRRHEVLERDRLKNKEKWGEYNESTKYKPQEWDVNFAPTGKKIGFDQGIRTNYRPLPKFLTPFKSQNEGFVGKKPTKNDTSDWQPYPKPKISILSIGSFGKHSKNYNPVKKVSYPDFKTSNKSVVRNNLIRDDYDNDYKYHDKSLDFNIPLKIKSTPIKPKSPPSRKISGSQYMSKSDLDRVEKQLGLTPSQKEKKRKYYQKKSKKGGL